jgi:predicted aconitase
MTKLVTGSNVVAESSRNPVGSQRSWTPNTQASITPSQKIGIDTPASAQSRERLSSHEFRHTADTIPIGIPKASASRIAAVASSTVAGNRRRRSTRTGSPRTIETPRSPRSTRPM